MSQDLLYQVEDHVALLTINRESRRNAISQEMIHAFIGFLEDADQDEEVRAVCVTGSGDKAFCSGADLLVTLGKEGDDRLAGAKKYAELLKRLSRFEKPLVARVNGHCLAGGLGLMLSCDIVIARDDALFFTPEVNVGIFPMMVGALLYRNMGRKKAMEMVLTGRKYSAKEAERAGLIGLEARRQRPLEHDLPVKGKLPDQEGLRSTVRVQPTQHSVTVHLGADIFIGPGLVPLGRVSSGTIGQFAFQCFGRV